MSKRAQAVSANRGRRRLATLAEVADFTRQSVDTVRRDIARGVYPAYRLGPRRLLVDLDEVEASLRIVPTVGTVGR